MGNAAELRRVTGAPIGIHELDAPVLAGRERPAKGRRTMGLLLRALRVSPITADVTLRAGDVIGDLEVTHAPGHTAGSIALLRQDGVLFSGDALLADRHGRVRPPSASSGREGRVRQHPAGDGASGKPVLKQDPGRVVGPLTGPADDVDLAVAGELVEARPELWERDVQHIRHPFDGELSGLADVQKERMGVVPVGHRHVAAEDIRGDHARKVDGRLRAAELRRVGELRFLQVVDGGPELEGDGDRVDPLVDAVEPNGLRTEEPPSDLRNRIFMARYSAPG